MRGEYLSADSAKGLAMGAVMRVPFRSAAAGLRADALERVSCPDGAEFSSEFKDFMGRKAPSREPVVMAQIAALRPAPAGRVWRVISSRSQSSASRTMVERSS